jgi:hypothetical protein
MTDKSSILRAFNNHFFEFIEDVIIIFPENLAVQKSKISFDAIKRANPTAIIKAWYKFIYSPYNAVIEQGDITFFYETDYASDLSHLRNADKIMSIIDSLKDPIKQMEPTNKEYTMKYIQNLSKLSVIYSQI